jgi:beta-galactosidase/beta-glucuronidase
MTSSTTSPRPEHPRPDLHRTAGESWVSLNGPWDFEFDPQDLGEAAGWQRPEHDGFSRAIIVPFPWESHAAWGTEAWAGTDNWFSTQAFLDPGRVNRDNYTQAPRHTNGWYRRRVAVPECREGEHLWLHIGAADWEVKVWVNGQPVGEGQSGYVPFSCDITE